MDEGKGEAMSRDLTDPESMIWAVAFVAGLKEANDTLTVGPDFRHRRHDHAAERAHQAVCALREIRLRGRHEAPIYRMVRDFRLDPPPPRTCDVCGDTPCRMECDK
jgi:hypothetical protein